jgi:hypothetical protein
MDLIVLIVDESIRYDNLLIMCICTHAAYTQHTHSTEERTHPRPCVGFAHDPVTDIPQRLLSFSEIPELPELPVPVESESVLL